MNSIQHTIFSTPFSNELSKRMLLLDGGMGTLLQKGGIFDGPAELLNITHPERVIEVHRAYLEAGVDIITTNTFSAHSVALAEYDLSDRAEELAFSGAKLAREIVDAYVKNDGKGRFVAGTMGPTNRSLTLDAESVRPGFEQMASAYQEQARGLIRGGVDIVLVETVFDLMNAKAAVEGVKRAMRDMGVKVDLWISLTLADAYGRMLTGYHLDDCVRAMLYAHPTVMSLNCGFGPQTMIPFAERLSTLFEGYIGIHPNAGLPDADGKYTLSAEEFSNQLQPIIESGMLSVVGGCCGTTDAHIRALKTAVRKVVRRIDDRVSAYESSPFYLVGERCNVAGSRLFRTMVTEGRYDDATNLALCQLEHGASIIDVNVDTPLLDAEQEMLKLLDAFSSEPKLLGVPLMIDSSNWDVVTKALNRISGKLIVNSISLKDGEETFLKKARMVATYGAGLVIMAADETGQATTYSHRMAVCERAYKLLREKLDFPAEDIIFDPNVLAICTGVKEHMTYASDLLKTIKSLRKLFPKSHIVGGLSNLSFAFRGCEPLRRALHSVFLHHARQAGMDMVILNPSGLIDVELIPQELRCLLEDAILRSKDVTMELMEWGGRLQTDKPTVLPNKGGEIVTQTPEERLQIAILKGQCQTLEADIQTLLQTYSPLEIITHHLMQAMEKVGELFGNGKLFLPQVIRSAEMMSRVVLLLQPYMPSDVGPAEKSKVILATVKGDVHDIGKNICATLLRCNGFEVIDLGVMVEPETIVSAALTHNPAFIGLSGLITPSLLEMKRVIEACRDAQVRVPILVGGATTSEEHTALQLAPAYEHPVLWTADASQLVILAQKLYTADAPHSYSEYVSQLLGQQQKCRSSLYEGTKLHSLKEARQVQVELY